MTTWYLLLAIYGTGVTYIPYTSQEACENAKQIIENDMQVKRPQAYGYSQFICTKDR